MTLSSSAAGANARERERIEPLEWNRIMRAALETGSNDVARMNELRRLASVYSVYRRAKILNIEPEEGAAARIVCREIPSMPEDHEFSTSRRVYSVRIGGGTWSIYVRPSVTKQIETWERWDTLTWLVIPAVGDDLNSVKLPELPHAVADITRAARRDIAWPDFEAAGRPLLEWLSDYRAATRRSDWEGAWRLIQTVSGKAFAVGAEAQEHGNLWSPTIPCTIDEEVRSVLFPDAGRVRVDAQVDPQLADKIPCFGRTTLAAFVSVDATSAEKLPFGLNSSVQIEWFVWKPATE